MHSEVAWPGSQSVDSCTQHVCNVRSTFTCLINVMEDVKRSIVMMQQQSLIIIIII